MFVLIPARASSIIIGIGHKMVTYVRDKYSRTAILNVNAVLKKSCDICSAGGQEGFSGSLQLVVFGNHSDRHTHCENEQRKRAA